MRWTLGLACLVTACFGETAGTSSTSADDTTESPPTTSAPSSTDASTETAASTSESTTATTSDDTETSGPDVTESSGADTTAGDACGMGSVPNPPAPPEPWSLVFVSSPAAEPLPCPNGMAPLEVGHVGIAPDVNECECRCDEPIHELCSLEYTSAATCPTNNDAEQLAVACQPLPPNQHGFLGSGAGMACDPQPVTPTSERVRICAVSETEGPCIDQPDGLMGPCLFQPGMAMCPDGLDRIEVGDRAACLGCAPACQLSAHCASAVFDVWAGGDCSGEALSFSDGNCHQTKLPGGSISARPDPDTPQDCGNAQLVLDELTVCCPM